MNADQLKDLWVYFGLVVVVVAIARNWDTPIKNLVPAPWRRRIFGKPTPRPSAKPTSVAGWINIATRRIVPEAQARIRAEIEAHYDEAVQAGMNRGLPEPEARAAALADLGDAEAARKRFREEHLTTLDANKLGWLALFQIFMGLLLTTALTACAFLPNLNAQPGLLGVLFMLFFFFVVWPAIFIALNALLGRSPPTMTRRVIYLLLSLVFLNLGAWVAGDFAYSSNHSWRPSLLLIQFAVFYNSSSFVVRLRKKLASAPEDSFPPPNPSNPPTIAPERF